MVRDIPNRPSSSASRVVPTNPVRPQTGERRTVVPKASFRGTASESRLRLVNPDDAKQVPARLRDWVREQNRGRTRGNGVRASVDVIGNPIPSGAIRVNRHVANYTRITSTIGVPGFSYVVAPGAAGGGHFPKTHRPHVPVVLDLFYPFYYSDPLFVGFAYTGYYPSVYAYFGWAPGWVYPERVYSAPAEYIAAPVSAYRLYGSSRLDAAGVSRAISDLRRTWLEGDPDRLAAHLTTQLDVRVYFDGAYSYTTTTDDFYAMTLDALSTTWTRAMDFDSPLWISSEEVFLTGRQVYDDPEGEEQTIYVSFRFRKLGAEWYLVAFGSSLDPIEHTYVDFRYGDR